jgi:Retroviral aspartyl protease
VIHGYFAVRSPGPPAPHVAATIRRAPAAEFAEIDFLIDTGADFTTVHPADAFRLWPGYFTHDFARDPTVREMHGIGGPARFIPLQAELQFIDDEMGAVAAPMTVWVAAPDEQGLWNLPSLLGRDIIQQFTLTVDARKDAIHLTL